MTKKRVGYSNYGGGGAFAPMSAPPLSEETPSVRLGDSTVSKKRYYVEACDNLGTITPPPPRDRTWLVMDRQTGSQVSEYDSRIIARAEAAQLNNNGSERSA